MRRQSLGRRTKLLSIGAVLLGVEALVFLGPGPESVAGWEARFEFRCFRVAARRCEPRCCTTPTPASPDCRPTLAQCVGLP